MTSINTNQPLQLTINPEKKGFWGESSSTETDAPSFSDFLDIINPLHHIPIVSNIYESLTGDTQSTGAKVLGGTLFGGPIGLLASIFDSIVEQESGKGITENLVAMISGSDAELQLASNTVDETAASYAYPNSAYLKTAALL